MTMPLVIAAIIYLFGLWCGTALPPIWSLGKRWRLGRRERQWMTRPILNDIGFGILVKAFETRPKTLGTYDPTPFVRLMLEKVLEQRYRLSSEQLEKVQNYVSGYSDKEKLLKDYFYPVCLAEAVQAQHERLLDEATS